MVLLAALKFQFENFMDGWSKLVTSLFARELWGSCGIPKAWGTQYPWEDKPDSKFSKPSITFEIVFYPRSGCPVEPDADFLAEEALHADSTRRDGKTRVQLQTLDNPRRG
jgi:hypothetical protein